MGRAPKDGASGHPPTIVEGEDGTEVYSTEGFDGVIKGYEFEGEEFNHKWDYEAEGTVGDLIVYEGIIVGSGSKKTVAVNKETGEKEWEENIPGRVGTPYDDKIPIAGHDGTLYELEMGMSEVGCVPRRGVSRGQEGEDCYDSAREDALSDLRDRHGPDREDWDTMR